jgi:hypothetical protein
MTQTIQPCSLVSLKYTKKNLNTDKAEEDNNIRLLLSIVDSLNNFYEVLNRLNLVVERTIIKQNIKEL